VELTRVRCGCGRIPGEVLNTNTSHKQQKKQKQNIFDFFWLFGRRFYLVMFVTVTPVVVFAALLFPLFCLIVDVAGFFHLGGIRRFPEFVLLLLCFAGGTGRTDVALPLRVFQTFIAACCKEFGVGWCGIVCDFLDRIGFQKFQWLQWFWDWIQTWTAFILSACCLLDFMPFAFAGVCLWEFHFLVWGM
jgi:hypothetical protein